MAAAWLTLLGGAVRSTRRRLGLTQSELGSPLLSKSFISQLEKGTLAPSVPSLLHIAHKLNVAPAQLMAVADARQQADTVFTMAEAALMVEGPRAADQWLGHLRRLVEWQDAPSRARVERLTGLRLLAAGDPPGAVAHLEQALALHVGGSPETCVTRLWMGEAQWAAGHPVAAARTWEILIAQLPAQGPPSGTQAVLPGPNLTACLRVIGWRRLADLYNAMGDQAAAATALRHADVPPGLVMALEHGAVIGHVLWLLAQEAYGRGDLAGADAVARLVPLLLLASGTLSTMFAGRTS